MNYVERDTYGMYKTHVSTGPDMRHGPGPELMGAETLIGSDVYNRKGEDLGSMPVQTLIERLCGEVVSRVGAA